MFLKRCVFLEMHPGGDIALVLRVYIYICTLSFFMCVCVCVNFFSYQHDHTPVEDSSVVTVTTG